MALNDENCIGLHTTLPSFAGPPFRKSTVFGSIFRATKTLLQLAVPSLFFDEYDRSTFKNLFYYIAEQGGYFHIQATRPNTLSYALSDSPVGLTAYLLEKFDEWSDAEEGPMSTEEGKKQIISNIILYHCTNTISSSMRFYYEFCHSNEGLLSSSPKYVQTPTAVLYFGREILKSPKDWIEAFYNLKRYTRHETGGHFPSLESNSRKMLVSDIFEFFLHIQNEKPKDKEL